MFAGPFVRPLRRRLRRQLHARRIDQAGRRSGGHVDVQHVGAPPDLATGDADDATRARELGAPRNGSLTIPAEAPRRRLLREITELPRVEWRVPDAQPGEGIAA